MRIENLYQQQTFGRAYINMQSLSRYGYGKKKIIEALKEKNTPLREYIKTIINTKEFEKNIGDCFISFSHQRHLGEGGYRFDTIIFSFPQKQEQAKKRILDYYENSDCRKLKKEKFEPYKKCIANDAANKTIFYAGFSDNDVQDGSEELAKYILGKEIVKDLKKHIAKLR